MLLATLTSKEVESLTKDSFSIPKTTPMINMAPEKIEPMILKTKWQVT